MENFKNDKNSDENISQRTDNSMSSMSEEQLMQEAMRLAESQLEDPRSFSEFFKKLKEGKLKDAIRALLGSLKGTAKTLRKSGIAVSKGRVSEELLGTGELTPGAQLSTIAPAKEKARFDPGVSTRR